MKEQDLQVTMHDFEDWMERWGGARTREQEILFYQKRDIILQDKLNIKRQVLNLEESLNKFHTDFSNEPKTDHPLAKHFITLSDKLIKSISKHKNPENEKALNHLARFIDAKRKIISSLIN